MKLALIIIGAICLVVFVWGIIEAYLFNSDYVNQLKGYEVELNWKSFLWVAVGTVCLIFGFCL